MSRELERIGTVEREATAALLADAAAAGYLDMDEFANGRRLPSRRVPGGGGHHS